MTTDHHADEDWNSLLFREQAAIGQSWAERVAADLNGKGVDCYATPLEFATDVQDRQRFENEQDIVFRWQTGCIEVKSRNLPFTSDPSSFPYRDALVDTVNGWVKKKPKPLAVVLISQITGEKLVVPSSTQDQWTTIVTFDRVRRHPDKWYLVDRNKLKPFSEFADWLSERQQSFLSWWDS